MAPITKPKVKVAPERQGLKKIWNISDWPVTSVEPQTVMVLGVSLPPGGAMEVPAERLKNAHKTLKDQASGLLHIGDKLPAAYLEWKGRTPRARIPKGAERAHGPTSESEVEAPAETPASESPPVEPAPVEEGTPDPVPSDGEV